MDSTEKLRIPKGSLIVVTGVNGYIASHVAYQLLLSGYRVHGTVRTRAKGAWLQKVRDLLKLICSVELSV
jgi:nucleoside-diphosphate-sugar epimerase